MKKDRKWMGMYTSPIGFYMAEGDGIDGAGGGGTGVDDGGGADGADAAAAADAAKAAETPKTVPLEDYLSLKKSHQELSRSSKETQTRLQQLEVTLKKPAEDLTAEEQQDKAAMEWVLKKFPGIKNIDDLAKKMEAIEQADRDRHRKEVRGNMNSIIVKNTVFSESPEAQKALGDAVLEILMQPGNEEDLRKLGEGDMIGFERHLVKLLEKTPQLKKDAAGAIQGAAKERLNRNPVGVGGAGSKTGATDAPRTWNQKVNESWGAIQAELKKK